MACEKQTAAYCGCPLSVSFFKLILKGWSIMADTTRRPPSLELASIASPTPSNSHLQVFDEKDSGNRQQYPSPTPHWSPYFSPDTARPSSQFFRQPATPIPILPIQPISHYSRSSPSQLFKVLRPWLPLILYAITSLSLVIALAFYRTELFTCV